MQKRKMGRNKVCADAERSKHNKTNHFLKDGQVGKWDIELLMLRQPPDLQENTSLGCWSYSNFCLIKKNIHTPDTFDLFLSLPSVRNKCSRRGDSQCHNRLGPAWQLEHWAGWGAGRSATALLVGSCVGRPSSETATLLSQTRRQMEKKVGTVTEERAWR